MKHELIDTDKAPLGLDQEFPEGELWELRSESPRLCWFRNKPVKMLIVFNSEADAFSYLMALLGEYPELRTFRPSAITFDKANDRSILRRCKGLVLRDREGNEITRRYWD